MKDLHTICDFGEAGSTSGRLDRVVQQLTGLSRAAVRGLFDHDCVRVNGELASDSAAMAQQGDRVQVRYDPHRRYKELPQKWNDPAFDLMFEDEHLLVVNKSAHMLTVPTGKRQTNTLVHALQRYLNSKERRGGAPRRAFVVHRLDRGVSGVMVFGKSQKIAAKLKDQFAARKPERMYVAIVAGILTTQHGTFSTHLATDANLSRYSTPDKDKGELAITHYEVQSTAHGATIVQVRLETGRRNQIRVHFAEEGHPVLGDPRYPRNQPGAAQHPRWKTKRLALHAATLGFRHPVTGKPLRFDAPLPEEFRLFTDRAKRAESRRSSRSPRDG